MDLTETLYTESLKCDAFIYKNEPFKYIEQILKEYDKQNKHDYYKCCDVALDIYNYYVKNGVIHDAKRIALMSLSRS